MPPSLTDILAECDNFQIQGISLLFIVLASITQDPNDAILLFSCCRAARECCETISTENPLEEKVFHYLLWILSFFWYFWYCLTSSQCSLCVHPPGMAGSAGLTRAWLGWHWRWRVLSTFTFSLTRATTGSGVKVRSFKLFQFPVSKSTGSRLNNDIKYECTVIPFWALVTF